MKFLPSFFPESEGASLGLSRTDATTPSPKRVGTDDGTSTYPNALRDCGPPEAAVTGIYDPTTSRRT